MTVRSRTATVALLLAASFLVGCGGGEPSAKPTEPSAARDHLARALDAWKSGKPRESLTKGTPSILMSDSDWERRSKLVDYKLEGDGEPIGSAVQWTVPLTLSVKGKTVEKKASYAVNITEGIITISRTDLDL